MIAKLMSLRVYVICPKCKMNIPGPITKNAIWGPADFENAQEAKCEMCDTEVEIPQVFHLPEL